MKKLTTNYDDGIWKGAPASSFGKARFLRENETDAEKILWEKLRNKQLGGFKFRRQHPISLYIADFYCYKLKLIIEVDGAYHYTKEQIPKDEERTKILEFNGIHVIRFSNDEILSNIEKVLKEIEMFFPRN
ncbi:endonuclease domain-containing protein [Chryseobacterium sp. FH1]|uniref:endonuclease domain-containing protein n=1 Tax=Chryseobacterium sp. FH1 TaxID=1233951 RepID=UPI001E3131A2|nr:endonuclease domain-containing protein [Chryseobacterium sp. FH1]